MSCFAVLAGGGTGGHVQPALAVAEALVARGHDRSSVHFVGSERGMEATLVPEAGFEVTLLPGRGIQRRLTAENLEAVRGIATACWRALGEIRRRRPAVVVTVGGYAGFPPAFAALLERIPVVVVSYDAVPGAANRLIGRFATANAVAFAGSGLPNARVTGPPVRASVLAVDRSPEGRKAACAELGLDASRLVVLATGGSLGARRLNEAVVSWCQTWRERSDLALWHVAGDRNLADVQAAATSAGLSADGRGLDYRLSGFEHRMPLLLAACDLVVGRAGASTVAELAALGVPSVLVPLPGSPSDHQTKNAQALADGGAAVLVADEDCTGGRLAEVVGPLLSEERLRQSMGEAASRLGHRDAADQIAALAESVARRAA
ncbi:MAG: UDP-N-acetylglucosamine--N-acetylmuramyl-(pentapeptide) pyrophosphoryl-undecaprenol N-acetylglucosamine transferase [Acidimicrobiales bacterium]|jgi:undecaprenyldiphospho-muramoylpentapeptide beta-N-acetylglucosaminyltransferase